VWYSLKRNFFATSQGEGDEKICASSALDGVGDVGLVLLLALFGVFMMRWNVVIGGQAFSLPFAGYLHYPLPIIPSRDGHAIFAFLGQ